jgi:hypothetical protein
MQDILYRWVEMNMKTCQDTFFSQVLVAQLGVGAGVASFSQGFLRWFACGRVPWPSRMVSGMFLIPGIGLP